jgi:hypothetical protein
LEHIGDQKSFKHRWPEMKAWLSDGPNGEWDNTAFVPAVRHLVSQPVFSDYLASECRADQNEALCENVNHKLVSFDAIFKRDVLNDHMRYFPLAFYPEESALRFFWAFSEVVEVPALIGWQGIQFTVVPLVYAADSTTFQVLSVSDELKLLPSNVPPFEHLTSTRTIIISAILLPSGTKINKIRVLDASKRERWLHVLKKLPIHESRVTAVQPALHVPDQMQVHQLVLKCDLYISTCRRVSCTGGRNMRLYLSAIMDSLVRTVSVINRTNSETITFEFGYFMEESSARTAANAKTRVFLFTDEVASTFLGAPNPGAKSCQCEGCQEIFRYVDVTAAKAGLLAIHTSVVAMDSNTYGALLPTFKNGIMQGVSFEGNRIGDCIPWEAYLEDSALDRVVEHVVALVEEQRFEAQAGSLNLAISARDLTLTRYFVQTWVEKMKQTFHECVVFFLKALIS